MVWSEQFVRNVGAEIYFGVHSYRSTVDDYGVFLHDFRSQFFVSQHIVGFVRPRYKYAFDTQIFESVVNSFGSTSGAEDQCFFVLRL